MQPIGILTITVQELLHLNTLIPDKTVGIAMIIQPALISIRVVIAVTAILVPLTIHVTIIATIAIPQLSIFLAILIVVTVLEVVGGMIVIVLLAILAIIYGNNQVIPIIVNTIATKESTVLVEEGASTLFLDRLLAQCVMLDVNFAFLLLGTALCVKMITICWMIR